MPGQNPCQECELLKMRYCKDCQSKLSNLIQKPVENIDKFEVKENPNPFESSLLSNAKNSKEPSIFKIVQENVSVEFFENSWLKKLENEKKVSMQKMEFHGFEYSEELPELDRSIVSKSSRKSFLKDINSPNKKLFNSAFKIKDTSCQTNKVEKSVENYNVKVYENKLTKIVCPFKNNKKVSVSIFLVILLVTIIYKINPLINTEKNEVYDYLASQFIWIFSFISAGIIYKISNAESETVKKCMRFMNLFVICLVLFIMVFPQDFSGLKLSPYKKLLNTIDALIDKDRVKLTQEIEEIRNKTKENIGKLKEKMLDKISSKLEFEIKDNKIWYDEKMSKIKSEFADQISKLKLKIRDKIDDSISEKNARLKESINEIEDKLKNLNLETKTISRQLKHKKNPIPLEEDLSESNFLSRKEIKYIAKLISDYKSAVFLMNSEKEGGSAKDFHRAVDGKGANLIIIKSDKRIFGGVTDQDWKGDNEFKTSNNTYLWSIESKREPPYLFTTDQVRVYPVKGHLAKNAILSNPNCGPYFGRNPKPDLLVVEDYKKEENMSFLNNVYGEGRHVEESGLAGKSRFGIDEYEVFQLIKE